MSNMSTKNPRKAPLMAFFALGSNASPPVRSLQQPRDPSFHAPRTARMLRQRGSPRLDVAGHDTPVPWKLHLIHPIACRPDTAQAIIGTNVIEGGREEGAMKQDLRSRDSEVEEVRSRIRSGEHDGPTGGLARGYVQANLVILPGDYAFDFLKFCVRNPKPCPILEVTDAGSPEPPVMAPGADLRTDVPKYRVLPGRATRRRAHGHRGVLAQRSGVVLDRVQLHVREGAARRRVAPGARRSGKERTDVRDR